MITTKRISRCFFYVFIMFGLMLYITNSAFSQGVAINTTGATANPSAILDVSSNSHGLLIPRMTTTERNAIPNPVSGLHIYNTDTKCMEFFENGIWQSAYCAVCPLPYTPGNISGQQSLCQGQTGVSYSISPVSNATSYLWAYSGTGVTINGTSGNVTLDFASNATSGNLTVQGQNQCGYGQASQALSVTVITAPASPAVGTNNVTQTQIEFNWNVVAGATGYKYNTINDYSSATDNGTSTTYTMSALSCGNTYTLYVWAYNTCNNSVVSILNENTTPCWVCGNTVTVNHVAGNVAPVSKLVTYGTTSSSLGGTGTKCWITRNLGATNQAASAYDNSEAAAGWYWQFNRKQGREYKTSLVPTSPAWDPSYVQVPAWEAANDPCLIELGPGWRLPTYTEWNNVRLNGGWVNVTVAYATDFKIHAGGRLQQSSGTIEERGSWGRFWTSEQSGSMPQYAYQLILADTWANVTEADRSCGAPMRCIKD